VDTEIQYKSLKAGRPLRGDLSVDGKIIIRLILNKLCVRMWIGFIRLRIWTIGGLL
jgi:hypothetical protein